jgi:hypothetical protein
MASRLGAEHYAVVNELRSGLLTHSFIIKTSEKRLLNDNFLITCLEFVPNMVSGLCYRERSFLNYEDFSLYAVYIYIYIGKRSSVVG